MHEAVGYVGVGREAELGDVGVELRALGEEGKEGAGFENEGEGVAVGKRRGGVEEEGVVEVEGLELCGGDGAARVGADERVVGGASWWRRRRRD